MDAQCDKMTIITAYPPGAVPDRTVGEVCYLQSSCSDHCAYTSWSSLSTSWDLVLRLVEVMEFEHYVSVAYYATDYTDFPLIFELLARV